MPFVNSIISFSFMALAVHLVYALIKPLVPSFIPPKYLTTSIKILVKLLASITFKIGIPAVPDGSPSSDTFL